MVVVTVRVRGWYIVVFDEHRTQAKVPVLEDPEQVCADRLAATRRIPVSVDVVIVVVDMVVSGAVVDTHRQHLRAPL